ncbi:acyltransferase [Flavobacterium paronense]|uniref:Acyltransferase family protein n=1 Tax=Flavobacterium paronense TaxID=1392775 RepID=A0ABV5GGT4_9FLAO|nr:acyltransferase [Flavobacterium paronense]MDN3677222.1 acyltransferase [Flavobacterium paronense]
MHKDKAYLNNLTALRGIAALLVVVFHSNEIVSNFITTEQTFWFRKLYLMVDLFFILSGFIMCYVYETYFNDSTQSRKTIEFLKARLARIYPLHLVTLAALVLAVGITYAIGKDGNYGAFSLALYNPKAIITNIFLLQSAHIHNMFTWNVPSWSISAEWLAYLVFPFLVKPFSKFSISQTLLTIAILFALYAGLVFYIAPNRVPMFPFLSTAADLDLTYDWGFARGIIGFVLGMCAYRFFMRNVLKNTLGNGWVLLVIVALYSVYMHFNLTDFGAPLFFFIILLSTAYGSKNMNAFFASAPLQKLGLWSYSIYMWHGAFIFIVFEIQSWLQTKPPLPGPPDYFGITNPLVLLLLCVSITLIIGALSYRFIEKPSRVWINNLGKKN